MAKGFRIRHKTARGLDGALPVITVSITTRPYAEPKPCPTCLTTHAYKTYHLSLDANGVCLVSDGVLNSLGEAGAIQLNTPGLIAGANPIFDLISEDDTPPPLTLGIGYPVNGNGPEGRPLVQRLHVDFAEDAAVMRARKARTEARAQERRSNRG
jgi:hypothetical protein